MVQTKVEESGEHVVMGTGELYLDSVFHDLRKLYAQVEIKVSEPFVAISETVMQASAVRCFGETPNKKNQISMMAEPYDHGLSDVIQRENLYSLERKSLLTETLTTKFDWDELTADSIWAFGPQRTGSNMLIDYSLPEETDKMSLGTVKPAIVQGF